MTKFHTMLKALAVVVFTLTLASLANAQATRTWVSGVGDDVNPCSRTAPCKTFAGAISKTANGGEIDCIDPGGFGAVTITKSITIDGGGTFASILASGVNGVIINEGGVNPATIVVTLRNLSINGAGNSANGGSGLNGVRILKARTVHIENCEIFNFTQNGIDAAMTPANSTASDATELFFDDVDIRNISGAGSIGIKMAAASPGLDAHMDHVRIQRVATGIQAGAQSFMMIRNCQIAHTTTGIDLVPGAAGPKATIENTMLSNNTTGLNLGSGSLALLSQSTITQCTTGIAAAGGSVNSSGNNRILGNNNDGVLPAIINPK